MILYRYTTLYWVSILQVNFRPNKVEFYTNYTVRFFSHAPNEARLIAELDTFRRHRILACHIEKYSWLINTPDVVCSVHCSALSLNTLYNSVSMPIEM